MALPRKARALLFDVFGTCVDWRSTVTNALYEATRDSLNSPTSSVASATRMKATGMSLEDWGRFAQEWRNTYKVYVNRIAHDPALPVKTIDEHHFDSLLELLATWQLETLWKPHELQTISLIWHRLDPWTDSENGIKALNTKFWTCTLSNGNLSLLGDLKVHAKLEFTHVFSAEQFGTFKPNPGVYHGAAEKLQIRSDECVMVAAHLSDLQAAKSCGYQTVYVERPQEEDWEPERIDRAKTEGFVDVWVTREEDGFIAVAERLGINVIPSEQGLNLNKL
jgi:2-haloacid dehalogenase